MCINCNLYQGVTHEAADYLSLPQDALVTPRQMIQLLKTFVAKGGVLSHVPGLHLFHDASVQGSEQVETMLQLSNLDDMFQPGLKEHNFCSSDTFHVQRTGTAITPNGLVYRGSLHKKNGRVRTMEPGYDVQQTCYNSSLWTKMLFLSMPDTIGPVTRTTNPHEKLRQIVEEAKKVTPPEYVWHVLQQGDTASNGVEVQMVKGTIDVCPPV